MEIKLTYFSYNYIRQIENNFNIYINEKEKL